VNHTWRQLQTYGAIPQARAMAAAAVVGRKIYVYGGAMSTGIKDTTAFCDLYEFNIGVSLIRSN
jgi:N-acetylneuraminic acid mutarotase